METIIIYTDSKKMKALKGFLKAFHISFTVPKEEESPYDPEFVKKVLEASNEKGSVQIDPANPWKSLGLT